MDDPLAVYLRDHLAGARFAIQLLNDLSQQSPDSEVARISSDLLVEVDADCDILQHLSERFGCESSTVKETVAWFAQKASRFKLNLDEPFGVFEAVEMLSLGVCGKRALWSALRAVSDSDARLRGIDLEVLLSRASAQFAQLERLRLRLADALFGPDASPKQANA